MTDAYIGLGSNLGDRVKSVTRGTLLLGTTPGISVTRVTPFQETKPIGPIKQPNFINGVICIETLLGPIELLDILLGIERQLGRIRKERWGPRIIDLDILLYGDRIIDHPRLRVPHPELMYRPFWLEGLRELGCRVPSPFPGQGGRRPGEGEFGGKSFSVPSPRPSPEEGEGGI